MEVHGVVRSAALAPFAQSAAVHNPMDPGRAQLRLTIAAGQSKFTAWVNDFPTDLRVASFVDANVSVRGTCATLFNEKRQLIGIQLYVPTLDQVHLDRQVPIDPFALPVFDTSSLMQFNAGRASGHRVRVQGVVTYRSRRSVFLQDASGGVVVRTAEPSKAQPGDMVTGIGFPTAVHYAPVLEDGELRLLGRGLVPTPVDLTATNTLNGDEDAKLVRIRGRFLGESNSGDQHIFAFQLGTGTFSAILSSDLASAVSLPMGSEVELTGVWSIETDEYRRPLAFRVFLRLSRRYCRYRYSVVVDVRSHFGARGFTRRRRPCVGFVGPGLAPARGRKDGNHPGDVGIHR